MAQRVHVVFIDDLDSSEAAETVSFGLDGVTYEIDLNADNAESLRNDLAKWVGAARRTGGRRGPAPVARGADRRQDLAKVREWARGKGYEVSDRGRISAAVQQAYDQAHS